MSAEQPDVEGRAIVAEDADEFTDKARLRSLFEARDEAAAAIRDASLKEAEVQARRGCSAVAARTLVTQWVYKTVTAYVLECEPLLRNTESGRHLLNEATLTEWRIPTEAITHSEWEVVNIPEDRITDDNRIPVIGLNEFLELDAIRITSFTWDAGTKPESDTQEFQLGRGVSEQVFRELNNLLAEWGIGLEAETDGDDVAEMDYSDLL